MTGSVGDTFDRFAPIYDRARRQLVPCFDEFYGAAVAAIPFAVDRPLRILDLGAGTGLLSRFLAERFRRARFVLLDASEAMLARARAAFASEPERIETRLGDFTATLPAGPFDAVVSALAIHHLEDEEKRALDREVFAVLAPGGVFVNGDQVLAPTPDLERVYQETWLRQARERGVSEEDLAASFERMRADRNAPLAIQLEWLREAGFVDVDCWFEASRFAVFGGRRAEAPACRD